MIATDLSVLPVLMYVDLRGDYMFLNAIYKKNFQNFLNEKKLR